MQRERGTAVGRGQLVSLAHYTLKRGNEGTNKMMVKERLDKTDIIERVAQQTGQETSVVAEIIDTTFEEIYQAFKRGQKVNIRNFGTFYIDQRRSSTVFKFNPAQRLKALFGWSSTYKGPL